MELSEKRRFTVMEVLSDAWGLVNGSKWPIWSIAIFIGTASLLIQIIISLLFHISPDTDTVIYRYLLMPIINSVVTAPFLGGAVMVAIKRARSETIAIRTGFMYFRYAGRLIITLFLIAFFANILVYVVHLPALVTAFNTHAGWLNLFAALVSVFVYVFLILSVPFVIDKNLNPWKAIVRSFQTIRHCWLRTLALLITLYAFYIITMIPLFVGSMIHPWAKWFGGAIFLVALIWLLPFMFLVQGMLYHRLANH